MEEIHNVAYCSLYITPQYAYCYYGEKSLNLVASNRCKLLTLDKARTGTDQILTSVFFLIRPVLCPNSIRQQLSIQRSAVSILT